MTETIIENKQKFFDLWAPRYDRLFPSVFYQAVHKRLLEFVELPDAVQVLDLGCGTGRLLNRLASTYPNLTAIGVDLSQEMLKQAVERNHYPSRLTFRSGNAENLPFQDREFNAVFCTISFLHYPNPEIVLQEIKRVLKPGGCFYWVDVTIGEELQQLLTTIPIPSQKNVSVYSPQQREKLAQEAGFTFLSHHYLLLAALLSIFRV